MSKAKLLVISSDLEIGGIERSLIGLLGSFDYQRFDVDLMLYRHQGPFMRYLPKGPRLLPTIPEYTTFQRPIMQIVLEGHIHIALARLRARFSSQLDGRRHNLSEPGYLSIQRAWRYALPFLPKIPGRYDIAISFMGPHYAAIERVDAKNKIGWIHTDYQTIPVDDPHESEMWGKLDKIAAVSDECRAAFLHRFPQLAQKTIVVENILSPEFIRQQALEFDASAEMPPQDGVTRILSVGRFCHQKGFDQAIIACRSLIDHGCNICWYVVGYGGDEALMRALIVENRLEDRFIILGKKVNPYPYMMACDLYAQPSRYEGKAVTVREAQILGKPVLITRFPTAASQLDHGVDGDICELGVDGIVAGVRRLIDDTNYCHRLAATAASRDYGNTDEVEKIYSLIRQASATEC